MATPPDKPSSSRILVISLLAFAIVLLPFVLLAIGLLDERLSTTRPVAKFYRAIAIWEPLEELHDGIASLFGG